MSEQVRCFMCGKRDFEENMHYMDINGSGRSFMICEQCASKLKHRVFDEEVIEEEED